MMNLQRLAGLLGLFCAIVSAGVLVMFTTSLAVSGQVGQSTIWVLSVMAMLSIAAAWAAIRERALLLLAIFVVTFLPVGLYLAGVPSWVRIAGIAQFGFLISALMMFRARRMR